MGTPNIDKVEKDSITDRKIMIVEDEPILSSMLTEVLGDKFELVICKNGLEAVDYIQKPHHGIDLILMDIIMPKLDGVKAFERIRELDPVVKVLFMSGYFQTEAVEQIGREENIAYLQKPFRPDRLMNFISSSLQIH